MSQSLFHQVCVRSHVNGRVVSIRRESQSLFHQVCVRSLSMWEHVPKFMSQSLFHQVCVRSIGESPTPAGAKGRNPFFIRSVFVPNRCQSSVGKFKVAIPFSSGLCSFRDSGRNSGITPPVAIPFSSGLCSFRTPTKHTAKTTRYDDTCADSWLFTGQPVFHLLLV